MRTVSQPTQHEYHNLVEHFLALSSRDRILLFGELLSAADICGYVDSILCEAENVVVVHDPVPDLAGVMRLVLHGEFAVLGLSVASWARRQGIGALLLQRAVRLAQLRQAKFLYVRNLGNPGLRRLVQRMGIHVAWRPDDPSAQLELPPADGPALRDRTCSGKTTCADSFLLPRVESLPWASTRQ